MDAERRRHLIERYRDGYDEVCRALEGISDRELDTPEASGEWSPRQVVHHLADSEIESAFRIRRLVAEENASIHGYDPDRFAATLYYDRPIESSLDAFRAARVVTAEFLDRMTDADWASAGTHSESGPYTAETWLRIYSNHAHDHADQIRRARAAAQAELDQKPLD
jgi:hypothetical protein